MHCMAWGVVGSMESELTPLKPKLPLLHFMRWEFRFQALLLHLLFVTGFPDNVSGIIKRTFRGSGPSEVVGA